MPKAKATRGTKRKAAAAKEEAKPEEAKVVEETKPEDVVVKKKGRGKGKGKAAAAAAAVVEVGEPSRAAKRVKTASKKVETATEYFEEKRNMEDLWKVTFPVGTEWDQLDSVYQYNWDFSNLEKAFEEGGKLYGEKVYLFGCTEAQMVPYKGDSKVVLIPVVVAVVSPTPPSDKIGVNSVQREVEEIIPMKQMKMDWVPYIPLEYRDNQVERFKSQIFILSCTQRRVSLRHLKIDRVKKYDYCLPYFYNPFKELEQSTIVDIFFPDEPPVVCDFDWEVDQLQEFVDDKVSDEVISEDKKEEFKNFVKEKVREAKKANREAREEREKAIREMSQETKDALEKMRFYKFYPVQKPDTPDVSQVKSPYINRYYEKAHEVL